MRIRRRMYAAIVFAISITAAVPATAETDEITDPTGDVTNEAGAVTSDPRIDITGLEVTNDPDLLEATVTVSQVTPFDDVAWDEIAFSVVLDDPTTEAVSGTFTWTLFAVSGIPIGILTADDGTIVCGTEASQTSTAYVLRSTGGCTTGMPRSLSYGALGLRVLSNDSLLDTAPDTDEMAGPIEAASQATSSRLAGNDRILTAIELSQSTFSEDGTASAVVLASAFSAPDALAGGPLAEYANAPMLLTAAAELDARVTAEIERVLEPGGTVYVLGGTAALAPQVETDLQSAGFDAERVAGPSRFDTAISIADEVDALLGGHGTVLVADGMSFTDALVAGAVAPRVIGVVVLTNGSTMPEVTADYLGNDDSEHIAIGTAASQAATGLRRIVGANPSELSVNVAEELAPIRGSVAIATQSSFADALAGGPHIANLGGPLLLTDPQTLSTATRDALEDADGRLRSVVLYGGTGAISPAVEQAIDTALAP